MKTYWVNNEVEFLHERPFRSLDRARALAAKAAEDCSWTCLTPPGRDNDQGHGKFRCGALSPHGISISVEENGRWVNGDPYMDTDVPEETFKKTRDLRRVDWTLEVVIDRGTGYLADGHDVFYYTGPEQTDTGWDRILEDIADGGEIVQATVQVAPQGRYHHLDHAGYPMTWRKGYGF